MKKNCFKKALPVILGASLVMFYAAPAWAAYGNTESGEDSRAGRDSSYSEPYKYNSNNTAQGHEALAGNGGTVTYERSWQYDHGHTEGLTHGHGRNAYTDKEGDDRSGRYVYTPIYSGGDNDNNKAIGDSAKAGNGDGNKGNEAYGSNALAGNGIAPQAEASLYCHDPKPSYPQYIDGHNIDNVATGNKAEAGNGTYNVENKSIGDTAKAGNGNYNSYNLAIGNRAEAGMGDNNIGNTAIGTDAKAGNGNGILNATAVGRSAQATASNSVALGADSVTGDRADTVSVGNDDLKRQITNVAAGTADTDAVNVSQLRATESSLNSRIDNTNMRLDRVGALAAAMSGLAPMPYDAAKPTQISIGAGTYSGEQALAIGIYHYTKDDVLLNAGYAITGSEQMGRVGVTWKVGGNSKHTAVKADSPSTVTSAIVKNEEKAL